MEEEKWFRFMALCFGKNTGKMDQRVTTLAPTLSMLKEKTAITLVMDNVSPKYTKVDRVLVEISDDGVAKFKEVLMERVVEGENFSKSILESETYRELRMEKLEEENAES